MATDKLALQQICKHLGHSAGAELQRHHIHLLPTVDVPLSHCLLRPHINLQFTTAQAVLRPLSFSSPLPFEAAVGFSVCRFALQYHN